MMSPGEEGAQAIGGKSTVTEEKGVQTVAMATKEMEQSYHSGEFYNMIQDQSQDSSRDGSPDHLDGKEIDTGK